MSKDSLMPRAKSWGEELYILRRKVKAFGNQICFWICRIFPIQKNLVSVCTFEGKGGFGCNPKYIVEELHRQRPDIEYVWFVNKDVYNKKEFPKYIRKVQNTLWNRAYWLSRSKVWIDNYRKPYGTIKRKGQIYINTWHGNVGFKSIGLWRGTAFSKMAYLVSRNDSNMIDFVLIDSEWCREMYPKGLLYNGQYLEYGAPRCDVLYGDRAWAKTLFRENHNLQGDSKVVMFAPTFREGAKSGKRSVYSEKWSLDFARLVRVLERKFGGTWYICLRVHPQLANSFAGYADSEIGNRMIDVSSEDDMYEILAGMDAVITDYSSVAMDAGCCHMPVFLYMDDLDKYITDRGGMQWNFSLNYEEHIRNNKSITPQIDTILPYPIAHNNEELEQVVLSFDENEYENRLGRYGQDIDLIFNGNASCNVAKTIIDLVCQN